MPVKKGDAAKPHVPRVVASMAALRPAEVMFAIDFDDHSSVPPLTAACEAAGLTPRFFTVRPDPKWAFQLARCMWRGVNYAANDLILRCDIDTVLLPAVLAGAARAGPGKATACSLRRRPAGGGRLARLALTASGRLRGGFSGLYWLWRPYWLADVKKPDYMLINNGDDTWVAGAAMRGHGLECMKATGGIDQYPTNEQYDWSQFQMGVWLGANLETRVRRGTAPKSRGRRRSKWAAAIMADLLGRPGIAYGWLYAQRDPGMAGAARGATWEQWRCVISKPLIAGVMEWADRQKTGMEKKGGMGAAP